MVAVVASAGAVPPLAGPALPDEDTLSFSQPDVDDADGWPEPTESLDTMLAGWFCARFLCFMPSLRLSCCR